MTAKKHPVKRIFTIYLPIILILLFALGPYLWTFISSITQEKELYRPDFRFFPEHPTRENYVRLFSKLNFAANMADSFIVALTTAFVGLFLTVPASYSFSRYKFRGRKYLLMQFLVINMFPIMLLIIPLFIMMKVLNIMDTYFALIIAYSTFTIPFSTWMMTSFFNAVPTDLDKAAQIDGCSRFGAMVRVIIPVVMPGIFSTGIYIFITSWNEYLYAAILTNSRVRTIPIALQNMIGEYQIEWGLLTAGGVLSALPVIVLFFFIQKQLISGMTAGAVKG
ncbi:sugar ABC transporter permease [Marispirochaeta aestuarii]|uniref:Sugar ABC transporter permease n=1 Tax=Marispirochaeta aestuarii TaxID=1963862 RepID=A0A1Y1RXS4_9SPIO|nr:carbohydrate ABC transporter permease [Marispirochaeta aestuarii]ORC35170.1 sugar ABC transporter permease [Marispirochaeta aestuarii]